MDAYGRELSLIRLAQSYLGSLRLGRIPDTLQLAAWERFYWTYDLIIRRLVRKWPLDPAEVEDCVQDVWCKLILVLERFRCDPARGHFIAWLRILVIRVRADRRRRFTEELERGLAAELPGREEDPAITCERGQMCDRVQLALARLRSLVSRESYQVIHLRWIEGRTVSEIAAALRLSPEQVRTRHHRMLRRLRTLLEQRQAYRGWG